MCHTNSFEELHIWKEARNLVKEVYYQSKAIENERFNEMMRRTALAVLSNIAEGYGSGSPKEFRAFLYEAAGCCNEIRNLLCIARYHDYLNEEGIEKLMQNCKGMVMGIGRMLRKMEKEK